MSEGRLANVRALQAAALELTGANLIRRKRAVDLPPIWDDLIKRVPDRFDRTRLSRFISFASAKGVAPEQVNDMMIADFRG